MVHNHVTTLNTVYTAVSTYHIKWCDVDAEEKGDLLMANPMNGKKACIMIVDHDLEYGIKLADWLAAHGHQAVLVRLMESAIDECRDLRPQAIFIGFSPSKPVSTLTLRRLFNRIKTTSPHVPIITMGGRTGEDRTSTPNASPHRHLHLPIKPVELTYIGCLLQSELSAAAASPHSSSTELGPSASRAVENRVHEHRVHREATT
jgi:DNA-binding NtrC family response regulator